MKTTQLTSRNTLKISSYLIQTNRYDVRLPWRDTKQNLSINFTVAKKRLNNLHTLQKKDPQLINKYNNRLLDYHKRGFIELVDDPTIHQDVLRYIPHFLVLKDSSTTAMRIAYDASARMLTKALSLNDCLYTGPNITQQLETMLVDFRQHKDAFTADIGKAFLHRKIHQKIRT